MQNSDSVPAGRVLQLPAPRLLANGSGVSLAVKPVTLGVRAPSTAPWRLATEGLASCSRRGGVRLQPQFDGQDP